MVGGGLLGEEAAEEALALLGSRGSGRLFEQCLRELADFGAHGAVAVDGRDGTSEVD